MFTLDNSVSSLTLDNALWDKDRLCIHSCKYFGICRRNRAGLGAGSLESKLLGVDSDAHFISETVHNQTESDSKGQIAKNSTDSYMGSFAPKPPSKVLGPLAVYTNEDSDQNIANNSLGTNYKSKISPYENPFYHKSPLPHKPDITKSNFSKDKNSEYLGSFDPKTGGLNTKPSKDVKNKISNKSNSYFVTPPPLAEQSVNENVNYFPNYLTPPTPFLSTQRTPGKSEIELHSQSSPEEVLQFIHQYPEISNYPSGSILEFHNLPSSSIPKQPFNNQGFSTSKPKIHLVPYIVPQNSDGQPVNNDLPPGISLEQILQEFQKKFSSAAK
ncbi:hypothetical protein NQ314_007420 [Rhamnusium bicolor]|uniref:Uncharacterized protein n=1 Tax=Rhamnusium bicolor TaxID=1586634 RepID=A0AAV8YNR7_9CUCU|nr:hypothetical protein NQ314_007420 [Rhamnusium bicolor]